MRSLLLHAQRDVDFEARLQVALDLARAFDAHLTLLQAIAFDVLMPGDFYGVTAAELLPVARAEAEAFRAEMEPRLASEDVRWSWVEEVGLADARMMQHAALADLAIVGAAASGANRGPSPLAGLLAVHCRAPVLVVPEAVRGLAIGRPAMVCWDGSLESSRALKAATPLLAKASSVHLVSVSATDREDDDGYDLPPLAGAAYLDRHGIAAELVEVPRAGRSIAEVLREAARAREAEFIVMGAYGQPRLIETLFGGVTRSMLAQPDRPVLMAH